MSLIPSGLAKSGVAAFYTKEVGGSLSFDRATPSYLYRTFGTPSTDGEKCFTISLWLKRAGNTGNNNYIMDGHTANEHVLAFEGDLLRFGAWAGSDQFNLKTNARKLRDTQGWYHIVCAVDTRKAVDTDRVIFYINGERLPNGELQGTYPSQNFTGRLNVSGNTAQIGRWGSGTGREFDGYMAEFHFIDAQQQTANDFGEFKSGVWIPKEYAGTYGNNGFYLDMVSSNFSSPTLSDSSGNSNNWTVSGIGSNDFVLDSCTNNYAVMNYWWPYNSANQNVTYSEGNRKYAMGSSNSRGAATMEVLADGCYFEMLCKSTTCAIGVQSIDGQTIYAWNAVNNGELSNISGTDPAGFTDGDIVAVAVGTDGNIKLYKNGALEGGSNTLTGYTAGDPLLPMLGEFATAASNTIIANFGQDSTFAGNKTKQGNTDENGQGDFYYTPPTGFVALCTANMPDPVIDPNTDEEPRDYFETFLYTGNGAGLQVGDVIKKPADTTTISNSLIFNQPDTAYLSRTPSASTTTNSATTFTVSCWFKPTYNPTNFQNIWMAGNSGQVDRTFLRYNSSQDDSKLVIQNDGGFSLTTKQVLRDTGRWYHIVCAIDLRSSVGQKARVKMWIDGVEQTFDGTESTSGTETTRWNQNKLHYIGNSTYTSGRNLDGYLAEFHNIDGIAYDASYFGNFDANGIWIPKAVTGLTYGDNGFYLDFADSSALGDDESGNTNDWTANNFATTDQVADSPTDNHCTFDPNNLYSGTTLSEGNTKASQGSSSAGWCTTGTTLRWRTGTGFTSKLYAEYTIGAITGQDYIGVGLMFGDARAANLEGDAQRFPAEGGYQLTGHGYYQARNVSESSSDTYTTGDVVMIAVDCETGSIWWGKNGTWFQSGNPATGTNAKYTGIYNDRTPEAGFVFYLVGYNGATAEVNFGQRSWDYTPPSGFTGVSENNITVNDQNLESPDFVWIKSRDNGAHSHQLYDSVRGATKRIFSDDVSAELAAPNGLQSFNTNGFTVGNRAQNNTAGDDYVAWCWKAGTTFSNDASATSIGTVDSNGSVNTTSGFSIVRFNSGASGTQSFKHGLDQRPDLCIFKEKDSGGTGDHWVVWEGVALNPAQSYGYLNLTNAFANDASQWSNTAPTSSIFTYNSGYAWSTSQEMIAYCFHSVDGFSKFGLYHDSYYSDYNADAPFVYLGFKPAFILIKSTSAGRPWVIYDNKRSPVNPAILWLQPNTAHGDQTDATNHDIDFMANGFKVKGGSGDVNTTGEDYIFAAFAEMPFKYATAR